MSKDPREKMAKQLLAQGEASLRDILTASFGEWPPKGLDINPSSTHLSQRAVFRPFRDGLETKNPLRILGIYLSVLGHAPLTDERSIHINGLAMRMPKKMGGGLNITLGHEAIHSLQGDHYYRLKEIFGTHAANWIWSSQNDVTSDMIVDGGSEIQARIHEILMQGYQRWGSLPQNYHELWAALENDGVKPPADIRNRLEKLTPEDPAQKFILAKRNFTAGAYEIDYLNRDLSEDEQKIFWEKTLPLLYADLIEMYGDMPGRERFGFGKNPKAHLKQLSPTVSAPVIKPSGKST
jgi:hypothetical protein